MIDARYKAQQDRLWDIPGRWLARTRVTPNQVTLASAGLMALSCATYPLHRSALAFALLTALIELGDNLDGALARVRGQATRAGAFLDAATDRYKELMVFAAIAYVHELWALCFACVTGATLSSYHKARAGMEAPVSNTAWPDLFERFERVALVCVALALHAAFPEIRVAGAGLLAWTLGVVAVGAHLSALQRMQRALAILRARDRQGVDGRTL